MHENHHAIKERYAIFAENSVYIEKNSVAKKTYKNNTNLLDNKGEICNYKNVFFI